MHPVILLPNFRDSYRTPFLHENELYCSQVLSNGRGMHTAPSGSYDVAKFLKTLPAPWCDPSLLVVGFDYLRRSLPTNLAAVKCPKVLLVTDTHHQIRPVQRPIEYARTEPFDLVILEFNRQHLHFFLEAGITRARWLPAFSLSPFEYPPGQKRTRPVMFMGNVSHHPYRWHVLGVMEHSGVQGQRGGGPREDVARFYCETLVNLNISLNGDLNLRVYEVLAAGGFLLTDRLAPESGLDLLFEDGRHLVTCDSPEAFCDRARHYLAHPAEAEQIAAAGHAQYRLEHTPARKIAQLHDLLNGRPLPAAYNARLDRRTALPPDSAELLARRLTCYELLQELHRTNVEYKVLFWSGLERYACDAVDLPRLRVSVLRDTAEGPPTALRAAGLERRVEWLDRSTTSPRKGQWNLVVCRQADCRDPLFQRLEQSGAMDAKEVVDRTGTPVGDSRTPAILTRKPTTAPVLLFASDRQRYRRPLLHENELFCSYTVEDQDGQRRSMRGPFDVAAYLKSLPTPWNDPSLLIVPYDHLHQSLPRNFAAVKCPKVLLLGDTHHLEAPLQHVIQYAKTEPFDLVLMEFDRHHAHFLLEAGISQVRWLPAFTLSPFEHPPRTPRSRPVLFVGNADHHPYRQHVLMYLQQHCPQCQMGSGPRDETARLYSETCVNLNISLNGDLNLRVFEVLAAGGCLFTDRLSPESGLDLLFQDRRHLVAFDGCDHLLDLIRHYLNQPEEAQAIAVAGHEQYLRQHQPTHKIDDLQNLLEGRVRPEYDLRLDRRTGLPPDTKDGLATRLHLYEIMQEAHRVSVDNRLLFWSGLERVACDLIDLPRAKVTVVRSPDPAPPTALHAAGLDHRVTWLERTVTQFHKDQWNAVFCSQADLQDPLLQHLLACQATQFTGVVDTWKPPPIRPWL